MFPGPFISFGSKKIKILSERSDPLDLDNVAKLMEQGKIKAVIEKRCSFEYVCDTLDYLSTGHARGKLIINIQSSKNENPL